MKANIDVEVRYRVSLSEVEVDEKLAQLMVDFIRETITTDSADKRKLELVDWITNNIHEDDCCDYEAEITDLMINGEPY